MGGDNKYMGGDRKYMGGDNKWQVSLDSLKYMFTNLFILDVFGKTIICINIILIYNIYIYIQGL